MKKRLIFAAAASLLAASAMAQVNSADGPGFLLRAQEMLQDGNYIGCIDQAGKALQLPLSDHQAMTAAYVRAVAATHTDKQLAANLLRSFLAEHPASELRNAALFALGDCYDGNEALDIYLQVDPKALTGATLEQYWHRLGCAYLKNQPKAADYAHAKDCFLQIADSRDRELRQAAQFYLGYIAYAQGDFKAALPMLERAARGGATVGVANYYLAQIYYDRQDWRKAIEAAKQAMGQKADQGAQFAAAAPGEAARIVGESAYHLGDDKLAKASLQTYRDIAAKPEPSALYILGLYEYQDGNFATAAQLMQPASQLDNGMGQSALLYIGQALMKEGDIDGAIIAFDKSLAMGYDPETQETAHYNYAVASLAGGKVPFGSAVGTFENFLRRYPDSQFAPEVQKYVISTYFKDGDYAGALASVNAMQRPTAETSKAKQRILYMLGSQTLAAGNAKQAVEYLQQAKALAKHDAEVDAEVDLALGEAYYRDGKPAESAKHLQAYLKNAPAKAANRPIALYDLGYARFADKKYQAAAKDFQQFLASPGDASPAILADANCRLGDCHYYAKQYASAAAAYDKAYAINPSVGDYALFQKGLMEGYQRHHSSKIDLMRQMQRQFPSSPLVPDALLEISEGYIQLGDNASAIDAYKELVANHPNTAQGRQGLLQMALTMLNAGQRQQAVAAYRQVISKYPTSEEALVATEQYKRVAADDGTLDDFLAFMQSVPNAPQVKQDEVEKLAFEAAEKEYITSGATARLQAYVDKYAAHGNSANAAKAYSYLLEQALDAADSGAAYQYACAIVENYPDNSAVLEALAAKAKIEHAQGKGNLALRTWQQLEQKASTPYMLNMARMGIARCAIDAADYPLAASAASQALASGALADADRIEALCLRGLAQSAAGDDAAARDDWQQAAGKPGDANSMRCVFLLADSHFKAKNYRQAEKQAKELTSAQTPHIYWMARGFILLADIYSAQGEEYKAQQYLQSLKNNYPGNEPDIFEMIQQRLSAE